MRLSTGLQGRSFNASFGGPMGLTPPKEAPWVSHDLVQTLVNPGYAIHVFAKGVTDHIPSEFVTPLQT